MSTTSRMIPKFSLGMRFTPTDEELIAHYLWNKVSGIPLPVEGIMIERDIYGEDAAAAPWELFNDGALPWQSVVDCVGKFIDTEAILYVFTRLNRVGKTGTKQKKRVAGCGSWHGNNSSENVCDGAGNVIGNKKTFKFRHGNKEAAAVEWTMHEFSLLDCEDYVLCKIKRIQIRPEKYQKRARVESTEDNVQISGKKTKSDGASTSFNWEIDTSVNVIDVTANQDPFYPSSSSSDVKDDEFMTKLMKSGTTSSYQDDAFISGLISGDCSINSDVPSSSSSAQDGGAFTIGLIDDDTEFAAFLEDFIEQ